MCVNITKQELIQLNKTRDASFDLKMKKHTEEITKAFNQKILKIQKTLSEEIETEIDRSLKHITITDGARDEVGKLREKISRLEGTVNSEFKQLNKTLIRNCKATREMSDTFMAMGKGKKWVLGFFGFVGAIVTLIGSILGVIKLWKELK